jgi:hypothetical protein
MISPGVGKRPVAFLENASRPSTRISNTPPRDRRRLTSAEGCCLRMMSPASRARGSYPHIPQYSISTFMTVSEALHRLIAFDSNRPGLTRRKFVIGHPWPQSLFRSFPRKRESRAARTDPGFLPSRGRAGSVFASSLAR